MIEVNPVLGIIGGGQLGSMLASAATKLKIKTIILSDDQNAPAKNFCDEIIIADYNKLKKIDDFISKVDFVTFEFENIPFNVLEYISKYKPVYPKPSINQIVQNRITEKNFVNNQGIKTTDYVLIKNKLDLLNNENMLPAFLKTCTLGYDGKGQYIINNKDEIDNLNVDFKKEYILEKKINLKKEISVIITRFLNNDFLIYEPIENLHINQILNKSVIPATIDKNIFNQAQQQAGLLAEKLNYVGTMCVEYFIDEKNNLLLNEIAPRVHNSGHLTINTYNISQFENHIRAVCSLKKIPLKKLSNAKMVNLIGKQIEPYRLDFNLKDNEFLFDYLKKEIKEKRKMGHITTLI